MSNEILDLPGKEASRLAQKEFAILPLGSIEYHGPHASLGTDTTLAVGLARRISERFDAIVYPPVTYTFTPVITSAYPGTISISPATMLAYVTEILQEIVRCGILRIVALNAHSENQYFLRLAAETVAAKRPGASVLIVNWWKLIPSMRDGATGEPFFSQNDGHGHGGPLEISSAAALSDAGVDPSAAKDIDYESLWWRGAAQIVGAGQAPAGWQGYHGRVSEIDVDKGRELIDVCVARLGELIEGWLRRI